MKLLADCRLYTFVDTAYLHGRAPDMVAQQLCDGGSDLIQLRAKKSTPDEIRRLAEKILPITKQANVGLVINDHLEIARDLGADFCHLGQEDFFDAGYKNVSDTARQAALPSFAQRQRRAGRIPRCELVCPRIHRNKPNARWLPNLITLPSGRFMPPAPNRARNP